MDMSSNRDLNSLREHEDPRIKRNGGDVPSSSFTSDTKVGIIMNRKHYKEWRNG